MGLDFASALSDSSRRTAEAVLIAVGDNRDHFRELLEFCFISKYPYSMRAARVIQLHCAIRPESLYPYIEEIIPKAMSTNIEGVKRGFLKIFAYYTDLSILMEPGILLGYCFDQLMNVKANPAIKIYSIDIIEKFAKKEPDLLIELKACLEFIIPESPPSIKSKGRKVLGRGKQEATIR